MSSHTCHARGCNQECLPSKLMCTSHWKKVPKAIQAAVYRAYVPGQEIRKDPTDNYLRVAQMAIDHVAKLEGFVDGRPRSG